MTFSDIFVLRLPVNVIHFMENSRQTMAGRQKIKMLRPNIHVSSAQADVFKEKFRSYITTYVHTPKEKINDCHM